jgi:2'-5' RNA ligase
MTGMGHTGGMIALVPANPQALAITDGEPTDELHLTLAYLGDDVVDGWLPEQRDAVLRLGRALSEVHDPIDARVFAHAKFNPDGGPDGDREPCLVYLVGDTSALGEMRSWTLSRLREEIGEALLPQQHEPFIPHITAAYGRELPYGLFTTGPVVFDRIRVALGDDVTDYPLGGGAEMQPPVDDTDAWFEQKVMSPDPRAGRLREYWAHGPGRRKWNKWRQLRRHLAKYVKNPNILDGLTSNIYRLAKGHNPPRGKSAEDFLSEAEIKAALVLSDPDAPFLLDEDDDEDDGAGSEDDADHLFEQALVDDVDWRIDADGSLVRDDEDSAGDWDDPDDEDESVGPRTPSSMGPSLFDLFPGD